MLSTGIKGQMVFEPDLVRVAPGDTVHFVAVNAGHDAVSIPGMLPDGAEPFKGELDKDLTVTFTVPASTATSVRRTTACTAWSALSSSASPSTSKPCER